MSTPRLVYRVLTGREMFHVEHIFSVNGRLQGIHRKNLQIFHFSEKKENFGDNGSHLRAIPICEPFPFASHSHLRIILIWRFWRGRASSKSTIFFVNLPAPLEYFCIRTASLYNKRFCQCENYRLTFFPGPPIICSSSEGKALHARPAPRACGAAGPTYTRHLLLEDYYVLFCC